jgi:hypothetical protein
MVIQIEIFYYNLFNFQITFKDIKALENAIILANQLRRKKLD